VRRAFCVVVVREHKNSRAHKSTLALLFNNNGSELVKRAFSGGGGGWLGAARDVGNDGAHASRASSGRCDAHSGSRERFRVSGGDAAGLRWARGGDASCEAFASGDQGAAHDGGGARAH